MRARFAVLLPLVLLAACGQSVFDIAVGQCINLPDGQEVTNVETVDCAQPHQAEAYHTFDVADGEFPGQTAIADQADTNCEAAFEGYVGVSFQDSELFFQTLTPTQESWAQGDREVVCLLVTGDGTDLTGSQRDSNR